MTSLNDPLSVLKQYWGYPAFRPLQQEIIEAILQGRNTLALLPTGGGKSICFQVPALCMDGLCIVVSPLISLMKDQVRQLKERDIKAVALFSGMNRKEMDISLDNCVYGGVKFLYVSPERLQSELFLERAAKMRIAMLAVDEAHCISQWGYDFRPPYLKIRDFIDELGIVRIMALTASATRQVQQDIVEKLGFKETALFQKSFQRPNLSYSAFELENKNQKMLEILRKVPGTGIVYVRNRKRCKVIAEYLKSSGISAHFYHAGLTGEERSRRQDGWINNDFKVMVATNAFGMGIDKPDVRVVVHYDLPDSLEAYYQEAGRAGRDEKKAYAVALFDSSDIEALYQHIEQSHVSVDFIRRVYQALSNFFKLAVGSQVLSSFEFDYQAFVRNFNLPNPETFHALSQLESEGLLQLTPGFREVSRIFLLQSPEEMYSFRVAHQSLDPLIKAILRLYGGEAYTDFVPVKEREIATLLKIDEKLVSKNLRYLGEVGVIDYQKASDSPQLTFLTPRKEVNDLPLDKKRLEWRKEVALEKAKAVEKYMKLERHCRSLEIQRYFGEETEAVCGVCDNCLREKRKNNTLETKDLLSLLEKKELKFPEIRSAFPRVNEAEVLRVLRELMDEGRIERTANFTFRQPQK